MRTRFFDPTEGPVEALRAIACVAGKRVLVTGAGGSIGSALACRLAVSEVAELILLDASEQALFQISRTLEDTGGAVRATPFLGSAGDAGLVAEVLEQYRPHCVLHAAAFKHVPLLELNPFAAFANNVFGTQKLLEGSLRQGVEEFVLVSTDKAVEPHSIMGVSKRIAELLLLAAAGGRTRVSAVRLGNVWRSQGSVAGIFSEQIARGGPVTITHPEISRYFMPVEDAVESIVAALGERQDGVILVPDVGEAVRIVDVAREMIEGSGRAIEIAFTELRPGDKMLESMVSSRERLAEDTTGGLRVVTSPVPGEAELRAGLDDLLRSLRLRDLHGLVEAVLKLVPDYVPSAVIRTGMGQRAGVTA